MFKNMDTDNSGTITLDELRHGLTKQGTKLSENELLQLMEAVSFKFLSLKLKYNRSQRPSNCCYQVSKKTNGYQQIRSSVGF
jgi:EF hand